MYVCLNFGKSDNPYQTKDRVLLLSIVPADNILCAQNLYYLIESNIGLAQQILPNINKIITR